MATTPDALLANVAGLPYYVPAKPLFEPFRSRIIHQLAGDARGNATPSSPSTPGPATLLAFDSSRNLTVDMLQSKIGNWLKTDDVFNHEFLRSV